MKPNFIQGIGILLLTGLAACSGAETVDTKRTITTYDVKGLPFSTATDATVAAVKAKSSNANVQRSVAPASLPAKPGTMEVRDALAGSALGALTGGALMAQCPDASVVIRAESDGFAAYGEQTNYTVCLWPYQGGTQIDVYTAFTQASGGFSPAVIGRQLASSAMGDSSQFITRLHQAIIAHIQQAGGKITKISER